MKVKVSLDLITGELTFQKEHGEDMVDIYWKNGYLGAVSLKELEAFAAALVEAFLSVEQSVKSE